MRCRKDPTLTTTEGDPKREMLRHAVATLAYRGGKVLRGVSPDFGTFRISATSRTPLEILSHIGDLLEWALSHAQGQQRWRETAGTWEQEVERFFAGLSRLDAYLASSEALGEPPEQIFQGPIADALTHVGQIAMLRRLADTPVRGENYFMAEIVRGRVGPEQGAPRREFD